MTFEEQAAVVKRAEAKLAAWDKSLLDKRKFYPVIKAEWDRAFDAREVAKTKLCRMDRGRFATMYLNEPNDR